MYLVLTSKKVNILYLYHGLSACMGDNLWAKDPGYLLVQVKKIGHNIICKEKIWVLWPFQEYFTYIELIVNQRWAKTGVPREKAPDLPVQNLASHMYREWGSNHSAERSNV